MHISDWSSDVLASDLSLRHAGPAAKPHGGLRVGAGPAAGMGAVPRPVAVLRRRHLKRPAMSSEAIIEVRGLWKRYGLPMQTLLSRAAALITRSSERTDPLPCALQHIRFQPMRSENLGYIGRTAACYNKI